MNENKLRMNLYLSLHHVSRFNVNKVIPKKEVSTKHEENNS